MNLRTLYVPLAGIKKLWAISFTPEKIGSDLDAFNAIADIAARGCLLMGGVSGMGNTFVICYGIFSNLLPSFFAGILTIIMMAFLFLMFDLFLGVAYPLFINYMVAGKFKYSRGSAGTAWMFVAGTSLLAVCVSLAAVTMAFSYYSSDIAVSASISAVQDKRDSTNSHAIMIKHNQEHLREVIASYDKSLKEAKSIDRAEIKKLKALGAMNVRETTKKYSQRKYSHSRFLAKVKRAQKDSADLVNSYSRQYLRFSRDKDDAITKIQASNSRLEIQSMEKGQRKNAMFDKYADIGAWFLAIVGCLGTLLFMGIKFVQGVLNTGIAKVNASEAESKRDFIRGGTGTKQEQSTRTETGTSGLNDSQRVKDTRTKTRTETGTSREQQTRIKTDKTGTGGKGETFFVPGIVGKDRTMSELKSYISRHANKWANIKFNGGQGNATKEYQRYHAHLMVLKAIDEKAYELAYFNTSQKYGITLK
jgi:hypothetical protein